MKIKINNPTFFMYFSYLWSKVGNRKVWFIHLQLSNQNNLNNGASVSSFLEIFILNSRFQISAPMGRYMYIRILCVHKKKDCGGIFDTDFDLDFIFKFFLSSLLLHSRFLEILESRIQFWDSTSFRVHRFMDLDLNLREFSIFYTLDSRV